ncbi:hypothetical protein ACFPRL_24685 [Pseudoclavibacter helvolus]
MGEDPRRPPAEDQAEDRLEDERACEEPCGREHVVGARRGGKQRVEDRGSRDGRRRVTAERLHERHHGEHPDQVEHGSERCAEHQKDQLAPGRRREDLEEHPAQLLDLARL